MHFLPRELADQLPHVEAHVTAIFLIAMHPDTYNAILTGAAVPAELAGVDAYILDSVRVYLNANGGPGRAIGGLKEQIQATVSSIMGVQDAYQGPPEECLTAVNVKVIQQLFGV